MDGVNTCVACGAELGVGRFCLNCGHPIGAPAPAPTAPPADTPTAATPTTDTPAAAARPTVTPPVDEPRPVTQQPPAEQPRLGVPVQAADPTPVPPVTPPVTPPAVREQAPADPPGTATAVAPVVPRARRRQWDPREELLPLHEDDDLDRDPVRGRSWIFWVAAAVLLVGIVLVLLRAFGSDDEGATDASGDTATDTSSSSASDTSAPDAGTDPTSPEDTASTSPDAPAGVGPRLDLATGATFEVPATAPPTQDFDGNLVAYEASQMQDGNPTTTWRTAGDATGQSITVRLAEPGVVQRVGLVNGYAKQVAGVDWYPNNRRVLGVTWTFDDGTSVAQTFAERPQLQMLKVPPVETSTVTITLTSVTPPGSGNLGRDYTAISEVSIIGRSAG